MEKLVQFEHNLSLSLSLSFNQKSPANSWRSRDRPLVRSPLGRFEKFKLEKKIDNPAIRVGLDY